MKKILIAVIALTMSVMAGNEVKLFTNGAGQTGGMVGSMVVFTYPNNDMAKITDMTVLKKVEVALVKQVCTDSSTRDLVNAGRRVVFIYPGDKKTSIFTVDDCSGHAKP